MLQIYACIAGEHDLRFVALAALVCALSSLTSVVLLHHVMRSAEPQRPFWLVVAAVVTGFGIWTTHFIAMLAYEPGLPTGYDIGLTLLSVVAAIVLTGLGMGVGVLSRLPFRLWIGGAVVGAGIATMHYTGMAAFRTTGWIVWDPRFIVASVLLGSTLSAAALPAALRADTVTSRGIGALLLTAAICTLHFTAMTGAEIVPDPTVAVPSGALPAEGLSIGVAIVSLLIAALAFAGLAVERRWRTSEGRRMQELADAAIEGLIVCDGDRIVAANQSFSRLACEDAEDGQDVIGRSLRSFFPMLPRPDLRDASLAPVETTLQTAHAVIPVELISRDCVYQGSPHQVHAVRDLRERKRAEADIHYLAHHDALTGLPNRTTFARKLDAELAAHRDTDRCVAVMFIDLDRFKEVNDMFGHATGDQVLQFVAEKMPAAIAPGAMLARLGGDEFAVIVPDLADAAETGPICDAILAALGETDDRLPGLIGVGASIGIALYPEDAADGETLASFADAALYEAKSTGGGGCRRFEPSMGDALRERRELQRDLFLAIERDELRLVYQPQTDLRSGAVVGFEALLRWTHATRGAVSPDLFVPLAEECGAILAIGEWVLRTACASAAGWKRPLSIAVNVSAVQLHNGDLPAAVGSILRETGLDPARLELEVTETALVKDVGRAVAAIRNLKALGVRIAMDDFGTGYSSLSNLRAFPCDKIKIDRSFIQSVNNNAEGAAIVRAILGLARGLKLPVIAEGVETAEELWFLQMMECDAVQGYLLGKPASIDDYERHTDADEPVPVDEDHLDDDPPAEHEDRTGSHPHGLRVVGR